MNDFANEIFTAVAVPTREAHHDVTFIGEYVRKPSKFPCATLDEIENVIIPKLEDNSRHEVYSGLKYRLQTFSNKKSGKKAEARAIFKTADNEMRRLGFRRVSYSTTPEIYESTVYSITATYEAVIDENGTIYRR